MYLKFKFAFVLRVANEINMESKHRAFFACISSYRTIRLLHTFAPGPFNKGFIWMYPYKNSIELFKYMVLMQRFSKVKEMKNTFAV